MTRNPIRNGLLALGIIGLGSYAVIEHWPSAPAKAAPTLEFSVSGTDEELRQFAAKQRAAGRTLPILSYLSDAEGASVVMELDDPKQLEALNKEALESGLSAGIKGVMAGRISLEKMALSPEPPPAPKP